MSPLAFIGAGAIALGCWVAGAHLLVHGFSEGQVGRDPSARWWASVLALVLFIGGFVWYLTKGEVQR